MFLSIVIPVYNGGKCITRCLDSIWQQGIDEREYEVICVNDGSTDNTVEVIQAIQKAHPNLRLLSNAVNKRAGGSRNHGVREARGEYIVFIDADDYFHPGGLRFAYDFQKQHRRDILMCDFARHTFDKPNNTLVHRFPSQEVMTGREFLVVNTLPYSSCKYLFKRSLMMDNQVFFAENVSCEDVDWAHRIAFCASTMQYQPILLFHYVLINTSQTGVEYRYPNTVFHRLLAGKRMMELTVLCNTEAERRQILAVAKETLKNGLLFLNALAIAPSKKAGIIRECVSKEIDWGWSINRVRDHALLYGCVSTLVAPVFRWALQFKRKLVDR